MEPPLVALAEELGGRSGAAISPRCQCTDQLRSWTQCKELCATRDPPLDILGSAATRLHSGLVHPIYRGHPPWTLEVNKGLL